MSSGAHRLSAPTDEVVPLARPRLEPIETSSSFKDQA
jgi:hypothetical protein